MSRRGFFEDVPGQTPRWMTISGKVYFLGLLLLTFPLALSPFRYSLGLILTFPYQVDREEGFLLLQGLLLAGGQTIYPPIAEGPPWIVGNYTPVYPMLFGVLTWLTGPSLAPGRAIALAALVGICACLVLLVRRERRPVLPAVGACALFLATYEVNEWIGFARADFPAILFSFLGLLLVGRGRLRTWLPLASLFFVLAFYTKQTHVFAPMAACAALLFAGRRREAGQLAAVTASAALLVGLILIALTRGQFWTHAVTYNANEFFADQFLVWMRHMGRFLTWMLPAVAVAWVAMVLILIGEKRRGESIPLMDAAVVVYLPLTALSLIGTGKAGAASNYLLEFNACWALLLGLFFSRLLDRPDRRPPWQWALGGAAALLVVLHCLQLWAPLQRMAIPRPVPGPTERSLGDQILLRVVSEQGPVLSEDPIFLIKAGREVDYEPFIMTRLFLEGHWDQEPFLQRLREGHYRLIVTSREVDAPDVVGFTPQAARIIQAVYQLEGEIPLTASRRFFLYSSPDPSRLDP